MQHTRLQKRGGIYYYRQKVPADLIEHYARPRPTGALHGAVEEFASAVHPHRGRRSREFVCSLKTSDRRRALRLALEKALELEREFQRVRDAGMGRIPRAEALEQGFDQSADSLSVEQAAVGRAVKLQPVTTIPTVDDDLITKVCATYLRFSLDGDSESRAGRSDDGGAYQAYSSVYSNEDAATLEPMLASGIIDEKVHERLAAFLNQLGYRVERSAPGYQRLCGRFLETLVREARAINARNAGNPVDVDQIAPLERTFLDNPDVPGLTIEGLFNSWQEGGAHTEKTAAEYRAIAFEFEAFMLERYKTKQAIHVQKKHVIAYRAQLTNDGYSFKTIMKRLGVVKTLFNLAVAEDQLTANPGQTVRVKRPKTPKARLAFEVSELNKIFSSDVYTEGVPLPRCGVDAAHWVPLIGLFTGMRIEEICQLYVSDIRRDLKLGWYFWVYDGENQVLKNESSRRRIPVHPELKRLGLIEYQKRIQKTGHQWLFPQLKAGAFNKRSSVFSKLWNPAMRRVVRLRSDDHTKSFHSFRHSFKHVCRLCRIEEAISDAWTGHSGKQHKDAGREYGNEFYPAPPLFEAMRRFKIPGLDLSRVLTESERLAMWPKVTLSEP